MTGPAAHLGSAHLVHMAVMGLLVSVVAPGLTCAVLRLAPRTDRWALPALVALPAFVILHAAVTLRAVAVPWLPEAVAVPVLFVGAVLFWAPVLGVRRRVPDGARTIYLYAAMPLLDLPAVWLVATGDRVGGIAMIVAMLPVGLAAAGLTWRWVQAEERRATEVTP